MDKRILILEDDFYLADDEKALLEKAGATVVGPFGRSCREEDLFASGELDAAVVDINLGAGPSFDLARALADRRVPFVFVTGYDEAVIPGDLSHAVRLEKPLRERQLVATMARLVAGQTEANG
ncbi:hypothetical protein EO081_00740 [Sphingomonas desiccabilis]|uniref:Response regulatory domain-containing protein n=2 Tax=Sphingomonas desiccabilis TaxID=429134 RepID=A0A4Q2J1M1_9SPHN|nr:hypothetical protein EO081_00740 [Sphingomonas desiccabilis]